MFPMVRLNFILNSMNYDEILGNELTLLLHSSSKYPNLYKVLTIIM